jgi:hypothetical protein
MRDQVMLYPVLGCHAHTPTCLLSINDEMELAWMGAVADNQYLAVKLCWDGGQEIQLLPLDHISATQELPSPMVAVAWQDEWHVMRVSDVFAVILLQSA